LRGFLDSIKQELETHTKTEEKHLINNLKDEYVETWNEVKNSGAKGKATGTTFEKWIKTQLNDFQYKSGKVDFSFGKFNVDVAMPSLEEVKTILEIKLFIDLQHTLTAKGLLDYSPEERKVGYVVFYEPKRKEIIYLLKQFKKDYGNRFDYFVIAGGWIDTLKRLKKFLTT